MTSDKVYVAAGSNLAVGGSSPFCVLSRAFAALGKARLTPVQTSTVYRTPAVPSGPDFANAVVEVQSALAPDEIVARLHRVERAFERDRSQRWAARTLDLDLLAVGDRVLPDRATYEHWRSLPPEKQRLRAPERLILPHPRLQDRAFVLVPWAEIAPDFVPPALGRSVAELCRALPKAEVAAIRPWGPESAA